MKNLFISSILLIIVTCNFIGGCGLLKQARLQDAEIQQKINQDILDLKDLKSELRDKYKLNRLDEITVESIIDKIEIDISYLRKVRIL